MNAMTVHRREQLAGRDAGDVVTTALQIHLLGARLEEATDVDFATMRQWLKVAPATFCQHVSHLQTWCWSPRFPDRMACPECHTTEDGVDACDRCGFRSATGWREWTVSQHGDSDGYGPQVRFVLRLCDDCNGLSPEEE